ncbi:MAG: hypothetical protein M3P95_13265 [Actinomycetota bacterium]|nr:hypothetical protein [Actinomycetota bacterium]
MDRRAAFAAYVEACAQERARQDNPRGRRDPQSLTSLARWGREAPAEELAPLAALPRWFWEGRFVPGAAGRAVARYGLGRSEARTPAELLARLVALHAAEAREARLVALADAVAELSGADDQVLARLAGVFIAGDDERVAGVADAVRAGDLDGIRRLLGVAARH